MCLAWFSSAALWILLYSPAIRVYRAGVLLYGQPPTIGLFVRTLRG